MSETRTSDANGILLRARRFLQKPWREKAETLTIRWEGLREQWRESISRIPAPIRLPFGAMWLLRNDDLGELLRTGTFESAELAFVERFLKPGMTVLDLGAHHGLYTLLASKVVGSRGKVIAFEPSRREWRALLLHLILNRCSNVRVERLAVGNEDTEADLFIVKGNQTGCNSLRPPDVRTGTALTRIRVTRVDDWLEKRKYRQIDFVKLDVEGAELEALKGASRLLEQQPRPLILAEVQDVRTIPWGYRAKEILLHLQERGYKWFSLLADGAIEELNLSANNFEGNFVACPLERNSDIREMIKHGPRS